MKKYTVPVVSALFILAIAFGTQACGGGGGSSTTTTSTTGLSSIRAEAALAGSPDQPIDPLNIQAGETIDFQVVGYDQNRQRHIIASSNWTTNDNGNQSGPLSPDGTLTATNPSSTTYTATGTANGKQYAEGYRVRPIQALVTGTLLDSNGVGASRIAVVFYNSVGTEVARAVTQFDGTFRASVPTSAKVWNLDPSTINKSFYFRSFVYGALRYTALDKSCSVTLPALTNGTTTGLGTVTIDALRSSTGTLNPPPPPPDGCAV